VKQPIICELCNLDYLSYALYGIWQQYRVDISAQLDNHLTYLS